VNLLKRHTTLIHFSAIIFLGAVVYANGLTGAFQFDDMLNIVDNPLIKDLGNLWPPSGSRWFGNLTFALNYRTGGLNPFGFHLVNVCIHLLTALSVYVFFRLTFNTPYFKERSSGSATEWLACACALLFVVHPIQTQAVTYVVQRFASLAALLYLLSLTCYIGARIAGQRNNDRRFRPHCVIFYTLSLAFALLAFSTKENAVTLPFVVIVYDLMFISCNSSPLSGILRRWLTKSGLLVTTALMAAVVAARHDLIAILDKLRATNEITRHDYLITQFRVIATYLRLLLLPVGQTVDHNYPVYRSVADPAVAASLALLLLLVASAILLLRRSSGGDPRRRLISFGIFWFFITLSVESGLIPINDVMFEHRLYLPSVGAILAVCTAFTCLLDQVRITESRKQIFTATILIVILASMGTATHLRNRVWQSELSLWNDVIAKTPRNPRGYNMVGNYYRTSFRLYDAVAYYRKTLEIDGSYAGARSNLGSTYIQLGMVDEGLKELFAIQGNHRLDGIDTGILYYNIAKGLKQKGLPDQALEYLNRALNLIPDEPAVHALFGEVYRQKGMDEVSAAHFKKAHDLNPLKY